MRFNLFTIFLFPLLAFGQANFDTVKLHKLFEDKLASYDLSTLWDSSETEDIVGFIGDNYQRLQIHYTSIKKDKKKKDIYVVKGKSKVKENSYDFEGTITITSIDGDEAEISKGDFGVTIREGNLIAIYSFKESSKQKFSGTFEGTLTTAFYLDKSYKIHYDDLMMGDNYSNNEFKGTWTSYDKKIKKVCNWGDNRIPDSGDLDVGVGEFVPNEKYIKNGWEGYCWYCSDEQIEKYKADKKQSRWWE